jgi:ELWxxDGT repeat protein
MPRAGDSLFLVAETATDVELWRSDGTAPGTFLMIKVLSSRLAGYAAAGGRFFLATRNPGAQSTELWAADGDPASRAFPTRVLEAPAPDPLQLLADGDGVLFSLSETGSGLEPWRSDGTVEGTRRIADLCPGPCGSSPVFLGTYGARAVLEATDGVSGREPWLTDGTAAGTWRLGDLCPGECGSFVAGAREVGGWLVLKTSEQDFWMSDGSRDGAWVAASTSTPTAPWAFLPGRLLFPDQLYFLGSQGFLWSLPVTAPPSPPGDWLESARVPGFRFKVRIDGRIPGRQEPACPARTLCASGALPARPEVFLRVSPSTPEGRLWPAVVKLTTSDVEVWALQTATGHLRHYHLAATDPAGSTLEGLLDRDGFRALPGASGSAIEESGAPRPPSGPWLSDRSLKGFQVKARLTSGGKSRALRLEPCVAGTLCLSGAVRGQTELLVRVAGPKPNGYLWPLLARFTPARVEVWIQQNKTGTVRYYRLEAGSDLDGLVDRLGFKPSSRR